MAWVIGDERVSSRDVGVMGMVEVPNKGDDGIMKELTAYK